jgi:glycerol-3-phosphate acyltransferase PlsY
MFILFGLSVFAYLLGSIPCGLILTKRFASIDIRQKGSGNIGATNVRRVAGTTLGAFTGGGKGVATAAGCFIIISPIACIVAMLTFILFIFLSHHVSAGSLSGAAVLPVAVWLTSHSIPLTVCALITAIFIFFRHTDNIKRLLSGTEPVI